MQRRRDEGRPAGSPLVPLGPDLGAGPLAHPHRFHELSLNSLSSLNWLTSRYGLFNLIPPRQRRDGPLPSPWSRCYLGFASDTPAPWRRDEAHPAAASVGWGYCRTPALTCAPRSHLLVDPGRYKALYRYSQSVEQELMALLYTWLPQHEPHFAPLGDVSQTVESDGVIEDYQLIDPIGKGNFGQVYTANRSDGAIVAVKQHKRRWWH